MINCFSCCMPKGFISACFIEKAPLDYALDYGTISNRPCSLLHSGVDEACPLQCMKYIQYYRGSNLPIQMHYVKLQNLL